MNKNKNNWKLRNCQTCGWCSDGDTLGEVGMELWYMLAPHSQQDMRFVLTACWRSKSSPQAPEAQATTGRDASCLECICSWSLSLPYFCESTALCAQFSSTMIAAANAMFALGKGRLLYGTSTLQLWGLFFPLNSLTKTEVRMYILSF